MKPEDRTALADLMRRQRAKIPAEIAKLQEDYADLTAWLEEFDREREAGG